MSEFTRFDNKLLISYDSEASRILKKDHWRVHGSFRYYIGYYNSDQWVDVAAGKLTDGATVPFPFNALIPAWGSYGQAVALHDQLCDTHQITQVIDGVPTQVDITRKEADKILAEAMVVLAVEDWRQRLINLGVGLYRMVKRPQEPVYAPRKRELELTWQETPLVVRYTS